MSAPTLPGLDLLVLESFLASQGVPIAGPLSAEIFTGGRSNLTFRVSDGTTQWVVRRPPLAGLTPSAHDVAREYRVMSALRGTQVPVPDTVAYSEDGSLLGAPFTVVSYVEGTVLRTRAELGALADHQVQALHRELIRVLAELHATSYQGVGLGDFGRPRGFVERQTRLWRRQWDLVATRELPDLEQLHARLTDNIPARSAETIVHGDYRVDNTLLDPSDKTGVLAVVDWEMATLGDPLTDVAMMCVYQHADFDYIVGEPAASTSPRWPDAEAIAHDYALATGRDLTDFPFYLGLAYLKLAVVAEGIHSRHLAGVGSGSGYQSAADSVPGLVAAGLSALKGTNI